MFKPCMVSIAPQAMPIRHRDMGLNFTLTCDLTT